jgi:hypothetical protein
VKSLMLSCKDGIGILLNCECCVEIPLPGGGPGRGGAADGGHGAHVEPSGHRGGDQRCVFTLTRCMLGTRVLRSFVWYRPGLCQYRFRIGLTRP